MKKFTEAHVRSFVLQLVRVPAPPIIEDSMRVREFLVDGDKTAQEIVAGCGIGWNKWTAVRSLLLSGRVVARVTNGRLMPESYTLLKRVDE